MTQFGFDAALIGAAAWAPGVRGMGVYMAATGLMSIAQSLSGRFPRNEATVVIRLKLANATPTAVGDTGLCNLQTYAGTTHYPYVDGNFYCAVFRAGRINAITLSSSVDRAQFHQLAIVTRPIANGYRIFQNGILIYTDTGESTVGIDSNSQKLGSNTDGGATIDGWMESVILYNRALTDSEILRLHIEPYAMVQPANRRQYSTAATAAFQPAWARGSNRLIGIGSHVS